jgi:hypothetical protein
MAMTLDEERAARAGSATRQVRTGLLAECGARVRPVYEEYWVGTHTEAVGRAVELGWAYATGGSTAGVDTCLAELRDLLSFYYEDEEIPLLAKTVTVVVRILESIVAETDDDARTAFGRGLLSTVEVASRAEKHANRGTPPATRVAADEETAWQDAALALIHDRTAPITPGFFDALGPKPPRWLTDWLARSKR